MNISARFIRRPVATSLLAVSILLCGWLGFRSLPISALPQVDFPTIEVTVQYPGANPDTMASLITAPLERQFGQTPSLTGMTSLSSFGLSRITLQFDLDRDIDAAAQDVHSAINASAASLPRALPYPPIYAKINPADQPILTLALSSATMSLRGLSDLADTILAPKLSEVTGVGRVAVEGGIRPAVRIAIDLDQLVAYKIGLEDVRSAVAAANVAGPKGSLDGRSQSYTISANDQIDTPAAYRDIVIANRAGTLVALRDVATIEEGLENSRVGATKDDKSAVILDIVRQPGANVVETASLIKSMLPRLTNLLPSGAYLEIVHDRTETIRNSIRDVEVTLVASIILVVLVVLMFLRSGRVTLIAGVTLPLSIVATFGVMWLSGFSLNNLSLMALTIGSGFIIDDTIVMIENIARHIEDGDSPFLAALKGAGEIGFTVVSLTVSLIAVFIPLLFMPGLVGRMFREFALTLSIAVLLSAVISLTLAPMMAGWILRRAEPKPTGRFARAFTRPFTALVELYLKTLSFVLDRSVLMLILTLATMMMTGVLYLVIPKGFLPEQDIGLIAVTIEAAPETSFAAMQQIESRVVRAIGADPAVAHVVGVIGIGTLNTTLNTARLQVTLKPIGDRRERASVIATRLARMAADLRGVKLYVEPSQDLSIATRTSKARYQYLLTGTEPGDVAQWGDRLMQGLARDRRIAEVATETPAGGLQAFLTIDREKAGRVGVSMQLVNDTLNDAFGQRQISTIYAQANQYRVILEAREGNRNDAAILSKLFVSTAAGAQVPLSSFSTLTRGDAPLVLAHDQQFPAYALSFDLAEGAALEDAIAAVDEASKSIGLPDRLVGHFSADAAEFRRALSSETWLVLAAAIVIYLVLGMLYESFIHPVTILSTLPSAGVGALVALMLTGHELSVIALIGIVLLMGIVKKNAIMMIDFAIAAGRDRGLSPREAIVEACQLRFRPIMMTTLAALFGALPLAFAEGTGSEFRIPLGITIIGGLFVSQILTLYTTPVIFLSLEKLTRRGTTPQ